MAMHAKTRRVLDAAVEILKELHPMTVRQVYYQLVSRQVIENTKMQYMAVSKILVTARKTKVIPWGWMEDRLRRPRHVSMWTGLPSFLQTCLYSYRRDVWDSQPTYVEVWLEKDALSGIFEEVLEGYGVTLNVGRGYDGWDSIHNAAGRFEYGRGKLILYFGDFDPSGEDMVRSLGERLGFFGPPPEIIKCALTAEDIARYNLPPAFAKKTDTRAAGFIAKHGDVSVELDALPPDVLRSRLEEEVRAHMDLDALEETRECENEECRRLKEWASTLEAANDD